MENKKYTVALKLMSFINLIRNIRDYFFLNRRNLLSKTPLLGYLKRMPAHNTHIQQYQGGEEDLRGITRPCWSTAFWSPNIPMEGRSAERLPLPAHRELGGPRQGAGTNSYRRPSPTSDLSVSKVINWLTDNSHTNLTYFSFTCFKPVRGSSFRYVAAAPQKFMIKDHGLAQNMSRNNWT